ncbi:MAG: hypothetical protein Q8W49_12440 [Candidatus Palauibacterales bacterium]|nr:hypothetical protein [Candidatus Palauibacterales bacterium]
MPRSRSYAALLALGLVACGGGGSTVGPTPASEPRTYEMGWSAVPPRPSEASFFAATKAAAEVSDVAILQQPVPWAQLLAGAPMDSLVEDRGGVADYLRALGEKIVFLVDPLDGLNRTRETPELLAVGRSILEADIRATHEAWVRAIATRIHPEWMGLASEINTLAAHGDSTLYRTLVGMIDSLAPEIRSLSPDTKVFVSFQVEDASGYFGGQGIDQFALIDDFDIDALGLSSYPVFVFPTPADVPDDYLRRFRDATSLPLIMVEGGWSSQSTDAFQSTPQEQVDFFRRYETLLDGVDARLWVMLVFADLDIPSLGLPADRAAGLAPFAHMGIVDSDLIPKPSYEVWKEIHDRPLGG